MASNSLVAPQVRAGCALAVLTIAAGAPAAATSAPSRSGPAVQMTADQSADCAASAPAPSGSGWEGSVAPYIWLSGLKGDLGGRGRLPDVHVDISFSDIANSLKFGGMVLGQVRHDRFVALGDLIYVSLGNSRDFGIRDPSLVSGSLKVKQLIATLAGGYRVVDQGPVFVDLLAGMRITNLKEDVRLTFPNRSFTGDGSRTLVDPIIGARAGGPLSERWSYGVYGDVGGFGVSSKLTWQLLGVVNYRVARSWTASVGWRHLKINTSNNGLRFDAAMDGPIIGGSYRF